MQLEENRKPTFTLYEKFIWSGKLNVQVYGLQLTSS